MNTETTEDTRRASREPIYRPRWWERRFPWLLDVLAALDPEPVGARFRSIARPFVAGLERACAPVEAVLDRAGSLTTRAASSAAGATAALVRWLPLPGIVQDWLWLRPVQLTGTGSDSAQALLRRRFRAVFAVGLMFAAAAHAAALSWWPPLTAPVDRYTATEIDVVELPPDITIPPPPADIARPKAPVVALADVPTDVTIDPTTFGRHYVGSAPPRPVDDVADRSSGPTFTPYTVAPEILNGEELERALFAEYPPLLRSARVGGRIVMWFHLDERGGILDVGIASSSGYELLDAAALRVADRIRFSPALDRDRQVPVWVRLPITFTAR